MPHSLPDFRHRAQLTELMDGPCSRETLGACLRDLAKVNRWLMGYRPLLTWLNDLRLPHIADPLRILDVGCGYGDGLRRIDRWARERGVAVELTGIDLNPHSTAIAIESSGAANRIRWITADVFQYSSRKMPHLIVSSLFTHHLDDAGVVRFVQWMERNAEFGWFINDLSRAAIPYHLFRMLSKVARLHPFVQHDGPVSIARSFVANEWQSHCLAAGLEGSDIAIQRFKPARLCVSRRKHP